MPYCAFGWLVTLEYAPDDAGLRLRQSRMGCPLRAQSRRGRGSIRRPQGSGALPARSGAGGFGVEDRQTSIFDPHWCNWRGDTVDEAELSLRRSQMGRSARSFLAPGRHRLEDQGPGYWVALSGAPGPDANMALDDSSDPAVLATVLRQIQDSGFPRCSCWPAPAATASSAPDGSTSGISPSLLLPWPGPTRSPTDGFGRPASGRK